MNVQIEDENLLQYICIKEIRKERNGTLQVKLPVL